MFQVLDPCDCMRALAGCAFFSFYDEDAEAAGDSGEAGCLEHVHIAGPLQVR
jgi:hypothetical protein